MTAKTAPNDPKVSVRTIVPSFVKPLATVRFPVPSELLPCTRKVAPAALVTAPFRLLVPVTVSVAWFTSAALIVVVPIVSPVLGAIVSVPVPPHVTVASFSAVVAVEKVCAALTVAPEMFNTPPLIVPPL